MINILFLPATEPDDETYGKIPAKIVEFPDAVIHTVQFPKLVWYNESVCNEAVSQIRKLNIRSVILMGFSKSGLGAWNIARKIPDLVSGTIIFDAPVARNSLPDWGTAPFYKDDASWQKDLPILNIPEFQKAMPGTHKLVLISGPGFHNEMVKLSEAIKDKGIQYDFLSRPNLKHHWNSGWIEEGMKAVTAK